MLSDRIKVYYDRAIDAVFGLILLFISIGVAIGAMKLFFTTWDLIRAEGVTGNYIHIITDVLTLYVMIELSKSLVEYFKSHRLRLTFILDAAIVFIVREILIALFKHEIKAEMIYAFSVFLLVLGAIRIAAVVVYQREKLISGDDH
ncbi:phosphate-starvation-inducible PsiE family protein [Ferrimonas futtsuensis]|uniref:phosphate-starvation-inducible PsiE family protein n=1 Tax=Ferrimonas futtsuensis TaxID=364764 RepID=UPI00041E3B86|nr:phosphate-starvation-inducible PsiE family protein [Ferrimonas futtsuensis]